MSTVAGFANDGAPNGVSQQMSQLTQALLPSRAPGVTGVAMPSIAGGGGDAIMAQVQTALLGSVSAQGGTGTVPFQSDISRLLGQDLFAGSDQQIAFVDASQHTTQESLNDQPIESPIFAMPWNERYELEIKQYMPIFTLRGDNVEKSPGFHAIATPVIINNMQARLLQQERDNSLYQGAAASHAASRRRAVSVRNLAHGRSPAAMSKRTLMMLRNFGSLSAEGLHRKLYYLGPVTQVYDSSGSHATTANNYYGNPSSERIFNFSLYSRGKIHNMFGTDLEKGDQLYFSVGKYSREQLASFGAVGRATNTAATGKKRKSDAQYVSVERRSAATIDEFVQVRAWSSRNANAFLGNTSALDAMRPEAQDRYYQERELAAAVEYRQYEYDDESGQMRLVDNLAEGAQEALNNVPDLVLENYIASGTVIPVGTVKTELPKRVTTRALLNAHYNHDALAMLPHIDIYQNAM